MGANTQRWLQRPHVYRTGVGRMGMVWAPSFEGAGNVALWRIPQFQCFSQAAYQFFMPLRRAHDAYMRQPVAHHGQQLLWVIDVGGDE